MKQIQALIQKNTADDWYRYFKRSRCHETLDVTFSAAQAELERIGAAVSTMANMLLGYDKREQELINSQAPMYRRDVSAPARISYQG